MSDKSKQLNLQGQIHRLPAGILPGDTSTELFGIRETRKVYGLCNGETIPFAKISPVIRATIYSQMLNDHKAMEDLKEMTHEEALEEFAFCLYGAADHVADFSIDHEFGQTDNFICGNDCRCLKWNSKQITVDGLALTCRQLDIVPMLASEMADKQIADALNITESTLNSHKSALYQKFNVPNRSALVRKAIDQKIIQ